ncbi:hypothetical protein DFQ28_001926 [Apophysomyces sp. BC1034]|nr:hypothetical protein DFQ30_004339 [Apophysomyces sp. BC1015]KAG0190530.1 hypothetical protein DFQ28_001926 [Apophysomyces sp. BC1034]
MCPRCNLKYCSLACYKDLQHADCTESFYKDNVTAEIQSRNLDDAGRRRMMEMLQRFESENDAAAEEEDEDENDEENFAKRFSELDIENADASDLWEKLLPEERIEFEKLISNMEQQQSDVDWLELPEYKPWWQQSRKMVQFADETSNVPELPLPLPDFTTMYKSTAKPSVRLVWNLLNIIMTYCYLMRHSMGEPFEDADNTVKVVESLSVLFSTATDCAYSTVADVLVDMVERINSLEKESSQQLSSHYSNKQSELQVMLLDDILALLEKKDFIRAIGDMWRILDHTSKRMKKKRVTLAARKAYFYLAFAAHTDQPTVDNEANGFENLKIAIVTERERVRLDKEAFNRQKLAAESAMERIENLGKPKISEL